MFEEITYDGKDFSLTKKYSGGKKQYLLKFLKQADLAVDDIVVYNDGFKVLNGDVWFSNKGQGSGFNYVVWIWGVFQEIMYEEKNILIHNFAQPCHPSLKEFLLRNYAKYLVGKNEEFMDISPPNHEQDVDNLSTEEEELLPCYHCGRKASELHDFEFMISIYASIYCECGVNGPNVYQIDDPSYSNTARRLWNDMQRKMKS